MILKDCCTLLTDGNWIESKDQSASGIRLIQTGNIGNGRYIDKPDRAKYISDETFDRLRCEEIYPGDILVSRLPEPVGRACMVPESNERMITAVDCSILRVNENKIDKRYLLHYLKSPSYFYQLKNKLAGTTRTRISRKNLEQVEVPLPSKDEQKYVAHVLDKIEEILDTQNRQLYKLDALVKARFVEMFGDPVNNEKGWQTMPLDEACESIVDCPHSTPNYTDIDTGYMCIRTSIVKKNHILWDKIEYISKNEYLQRIKRRKPKRGDVVYTREGAILGIAAIIDRDCNVALGQRSMLLSPDISLCCPEFLCTAMNFDSFLNKVLDGVSGSASPHINVGDIKAYNIMMPPIELQTQFAAFVSQVDKSKSVVQKSLDETQVLFDSLMQKYFG